MPRPYSNQIFCRNEPKAIGLVHRCADNLASGEDIADRLAHILDHADRIGDHIHSRPDWVGQGLFTEACQGLAALSMADRILHHFHVMHRLIPLTLLAFLRDQALLMQIRGQGPVRLGLGQGHADKIRAAIRAQGTELAGHFRVGPHLGHVKGGEHFFQIRHHTLHTGAKRTAVLWPGTRGCPRWVRPD